MLKPKTKEVKENKGRLRDRVKNFLKNKKAVAMLMEYIITIECFAMLFLLISPNEVKAAVSVADENGITWAYTLDENNQATNVYYQSGTLGETVTIPATVSDGTNEYPVVSLYYSNSRNIFQTSSNTTVKEIIIPEGITSIGNYAFYKCSGLTTIKIPEGVTNVGKYAFYYCRNITKVEIPTSVTSIGTQAFNASGSDIYINNLESNIICETSWSGSAYVHYNGCMHDINTTGSDILDKKVQIITASNNLIDGKIACGETYQFKVLNEQGEIEINKKVEVRSDGEYKYSTYSIEEIIPNENGIYTIENIERNKTIVIGQEDGHYYNSTDENGITWGYAYEDGKANGVCYVSGDLSGTVTIPAMLDRYPVTNLWRASGNVPCNIFGKSEEIKKIEKLIISEGIKQINWSAFNGCSSLKSVEIPNSLTEIPGYAFSSCSSLETIEIPNSITKIGSAAFYGCSSLTSVIIPSSVTSIGYSAFERCTSLNNIEIPNSVTEIASGTFRNCINLKSVKMPKEVTRIGNYAFSGCNTLDSIEILSSVTVIEQYAFEGCSNLTSLVIEEGVRYIGEYAFSNCNKLTDIYVNNIASNISREYNWSYNAVVHYNDCTHTVTKNIVEEGLQIQEVSNNLTDGTIACGETYQFKVVNEEGEVITNKKVRVTSQGQFTNSSYVTEEIYPNEKGIYTIENIERNKTIKVGIANGERFQATDENGITWEYRYEDGKARALKYISGNIPETLEVPATIDGLVVTTMANEALKGQNVKNVILPDSIVNIGQSAFSYCTNLETVVLPEGLQFISNHAFSGCTNLRQVELPEDLIVISDYAFYGCTNLKLDLTLNSKLKVIGREAFYNCTSLEGKLVIPGEMVQISAGAFKGCTGITEIEVLKNTNEEVDESRVYFSSGNWYRYSMNESSNMIYDDTSMYTNEYTINNVVTDQNGNIVYDENGNEVVESFVIQVTGKDIRIGGEAFSGCTNLKTIYLPEGVTKVGYDEIAGCENLTDIYIDMLRKEMREEPNTRGQVNVHYRNCMHKIEIIGSEIAKGLKVETVSGELKDGQIVCEGTYQFKLVNEEGQTVTDKQVRIRKSQADISTAEVMTPNEEGIYTVEYVKADTTIIIGNNNGETAQYTDENGITWEYRYEDGKARALKYVSGSIPETLEIPTKIDNLIVTTIADEALKEQNVKNVILPDSIVNIGQSAFENCTILETIVLPEGLQLISNASFKGCTNLKQVELPDDLLVIGNEAFSGCSNLRMDLEFKEGIKSIGKESFKDCISLTGELILPGSTIQISSGAFKGCTGITKVDVLNSKEDIDQTKVGFSSDGWSINSDVNESGTSLSINQYESMTGILKNDVIENKVVVDENGEEVKDEWGNNVTENIIVGTIIKREITIGGEAFSGCNNLTAIYLPAGTNKVNYNTITGCDNLRDLYIGTKKKDMLEEVQTNGQLNVHYLDCSHKVEIQKFEGTSIEEVSGIAEDGMAACLQNYKFKVNIAEGSTLKGVVVKVGNVGEEKEAIKPDENGIYTIENVTKDKEVSIEEGRIVEVRYIDKDGNKIAKSTILVGEEGESYKAERKEIANYKAVGVEPSNSEGTFTEEEIVVTYVYEKIPSGTLTIKYVDKDGKDIIDPDTKQGYVGDEYEIFRKNIRGYKAYGVTPENAKGIYTEEDVEIIFVYEEIKEEETVIKYVDEEGNYIARDKTVQEGEEADLEAKEVEGYENTDKTEEGKEIIYTYGAEDKTGKANKWTTEKTLLAIAVAIGILILIFIIIARREKEVEANGKKYRTIEEALEAIKESETKEIKLLKDIEREEVIEGLEDETIKIDYNGYEVKINDKVEE